MSTRLTRHALFFTTALLAAAALAAASGVGSGGRPPVPASASANDARPHPRPDAKKPRIEVAFVLDTTGSMGGLIEGAKAKIWSVANEMIRAKPTPEIRLGLVAYRDRGDAYVTQLHDLTPDIDAIYARLRGFEAQGGGDGPESVNQALHEAVTKLSWSQDRDVLKLVFLVGDAPPHMDYAQDVGYATTVREAVRRDLKIDTIQCGGDADTARVWQEIARLGEGQYVALGQTGDMVALTTPVDADIAKLSREMGATAIAYGDESRRTEVKSKLSVAAAAPASVAADKAAFGALGGASGAVVTGEGDLVADVALGKTKLEDVPAPALPAEMQAMDAPARADHVKQQVEKRQELQSRMNELVEKRDTYLAGERKRLAESGAKDSFDAKVTETIRAQAKEKGITYE